MRRYESPGLLTLAAQDKMPDASHPVCTAGEIACVLEGVYAIAGAASLAGAYDRSLLWLALRRALRLVGDASCADSPAALITDDVDAPGANARDLVTEAP